jgi:hypothetical protein
MQAPAPLAYSNLVLRTAQYNENVWEDVLKVLIGETLLIDSMGGPQVGVLCCAVLCFGCLIWADLGYVTHVGWCVLVLCCAVLCCAVL